MLLPRSFTAPWPKQWSCVLRAFKKHATETEVIGIILLWAFTLCKKSFVLLFFFSLEFFLTSLSCGVICRRSAVRFYMLVLKVINKNSYARKISTWNVRITILQLRRWLYWHQLYVLCLLYKWFFEKYWSFRKKKYKFASPFKRFSCQEGW